MKTPYVNFRELKAAVPIRRVLERYQLLESLRERDERLSGPCPLCDSQTAFRVNQDKDCFHCFGCKAGGNMLDLVAAMEKCSVRDAAVKVAEWFGIETAKPGRAPARKSPKTPKGESKPPATKPDAKASETAAPSTPSEPPSQDLEPAKTPPPANPPLTFELRLDSDHPWFAEAGLTPETVREFGLGFCARGMMGGRIAFPIRNAAGELVGYAGRWPGDDPPDGQPLWRYPKGLDLAQVVYPAERLAAADLGRALLASDPLRVLLCWQLGVEDVFFVPAAGSLDEAMRALEHARG